MEDTIDQPNCTEEYNALYVMIDIHNYSRQAYLLIEKKFEKKWDMRVNLSLFSIIMVDIWHLKIGVFERSM